MWTVSYTAELSTAVVMGCKRILRCPVWKSYHVQVRYEKKFYRLQIKRRRMRSRRRRNNFIHWHNKVIKSALNILCIYYTLFFNEQVPKSTNHGHTKSLWTWSMNPPNQWGLIKWYWDMDIISHSRSSFLTSMIGRMSLTHVKKEVWSGIWTGPRQTPTMTPGCTNGVQKMVHSFSLGLHTKVCENRNTCHEGMQNGEYRKVLKKVWTFIFSLTAKQSLGLLTISR